MISKESKTTLIVPSIHQIILQSLNHRLFMERKKNLVQKKKLSRASIRSTLWIWIPLLLASLQPHNTWFLPLSSKVLLLIIPSEKKLVQLDDYANTAWQVVCSWALDIVKQYLNNKTLYCWQPLLLSIVHHLPITVCLRLYLPLPTFCPDLWLFFFFLFHFLSRKQFTFSHCGCCFSPMKSPHVTVFGRVALD